jgi:quercetin dioxygenase-like cupin family protein
VTTHTDSAVINWATLPEHRPVEGITGSVQLGTELSTALFRLEPRAVVPRHHHVSEEFGQVLSGSLELEVDSHHSALVTGDSFLIPGNVPHAAVAGPEGCLLLECYAPPRNPFAPQDPGRSS